MTSTQHLKCFDSFTREISRRKKKDPKVNDIALCVVRSKENNENGFYDM